jgi:hypothetical protein
MSLFSAGSISLDSTFKAESWKAKVEVGILFREDRFHYKNNCWLLYKKPSGKK